jgi:hypothetical protein
MRESLLTIPVNEVFEPKCGCPICLLRDTIEEHICDYIMGAAMMEPDVRISTNQEGFCLSHYEKMLRMNNRLSLALMLDTHLQTIRETRFKSGLFKKKPQPYQQTCFVCSKISWGVHHTLKTVYTMFTKDPDFRKLFMEQEFYCLPHYHLMLSFGQEQMNKKDYGEFEKALNDFMASYTEKLNEDVHAFCNSFDYRNAKTLHTPEMAHVKQSVSRAVRFLTGKPEDKE